MERGEIERLRELLERASPGPWAYADDERFPNEAIIRLGAGYIECGGSRSRREANAELIVAMHIALPALLRLALLGKRVEEGRFINCNGGKPCDGPGGWCIGTCQRVAQKVGVE